MPASTHTEVQLLVAFVDLTRFMEVSRRLDERRIATLLDELYERVGARVSAAGGRVVKFLGDGALLAFAEDAVDAGVAALVDLKGEIDGWLKGQGYDSRLTVKAHFGPVVAGEFGARGDKRFDVVGRTVNTAALLDTRSLAITPQAFRRLEPATRRRFKKHTPPVTYIPVEAAHRTS